MTGETEPEASVEAQEAERRSPRIYVASLSDYNAGVLHGAWLEAAADVPALEEAIARMLTTSPTARLYGEVAEEWAIHDFEGFGPVQLSEWESLLNVSLVARGTAEHGSPFAAWWHLSEMDLATSELPDGDEEDLWHEELLEACVERFENQYRGEFDSLTAYCEEFITDVYGLDFDNLPGIPQALANYITIDATALARDMELEGSVSTIQGGRGVYVFDLTY